MQPFPVELAKLCSNGKDETKVKGATGFNTDESTDVPTDDLAEESDVPCTPMNSLPAGDVVRHGQCLECSSEAGSTVPRPPTGAAFQQEVSSMAQEVAEVLNRLHCCSHAEVRLDSSTDDQGVCTLFATLGEEDSHAVEEISSAAKDAIFSRTSRSRGVCLIGFKKAPFVSTPEGFTANLGSVSRKRQACRQFYADGQCKYKEACYWQHPTSITRLNFVITNQQSFVAKVGEFFNRAASGKW